MAVKHVTVVVDGDVVVVAATVVPASVGVVAAVGVVVAADAADAADAAAAARKQVRDGRADAAAEAGNVVPYAAYAEGRAIA